MSIMQLSPIQILNLVLFWTISGMLCARLAKKRGRHPLIWFAIGFVVTIFGILLLYLMPPAGKSKRRTTPPAPPLQRDEAWIKMWYYLDPQSREQKGPMEFPDLAKIWKDKALNDKSLIWGEGMKEWKQVSDLPDIVKEMEKV